MRRAGILYLITVILLTAIFGQISLAGAAPVTAQVIIPPISTSLDPVSIPRSDYSARNLTENLFVGLTRYNPLSGQVEPALSSDWSVSDDGLTYIFNLRKDIQWVTYNSLTQQVEAVRPVVAGDFVYGIRRACDPTPPNPTSHTIYIIAGCLKVATANPIIVDDIYISRELRVQALSNQALEIKLVFAAPNFPILASLPEFRPVPREALAKNLDWTKPGVIITNGPWVMVDWTRDQQPSMTLARNPLWPLKAEGNVERVAISFSASGDAAANELATGAADFAPLDFATANVLKASKPDLVQSAPGQTLTVLGYSVERPMIQKDGFRRALSQAIDRDSLVKQIAPGMVLPMSRFTPPGTIGGPTEQPSNKGFSPNNAKSTLNGVGYVGCRLPGKLNLLIDNEPQSLALAQTLIAQWNAALGCDPTAFNIVKVSPATVQEVAHANVNTNANDAPPRADMWITAWTPDYLDANAWTGDAIHCRFGFLRTGISCGDADNLVDSAFLEKDPAKRAQDYDQAEDTWFGPMGTFPVAPLFVSVNFVGQQPWLKGATVNGPLRFDQWMLAAH